MKNPMNSNAISLMMLTTERTILKFDDSLMPM